MLHPNFAVIMAKNAVQVQLLYLRHVDHSHRVYVICVYSSVHLLNVCRVSIFPSFFLCLNNAIHTVCSRIKAEPSVGSRTITRRTAIQPSVVVDTQFLYGEKKERKKRRDRQRIDDRNYQREGGKERKGGTEERRSQRAC